MLEPNIWGTPGIVKNPPTRYGQGVRLRRRFTILDLGLALCVGFGIAFWVLVLVMLGWECSCRVF